MSCSACKRRRKKIVGAVKKVASGFRSRILRGRKVK